LSLEKFVREARSGDSKEIDEIREVLKVLEQFSKGRPRIRAVYVTRNP